MSDVLWAQMWWMDRPVVTVGPVAE